MKKLSVIAALFGVLALQGCFQNPDNKPKAGADSSKASVQMQQGNAEDKK